MIVNNGKDENFAYSLSRWTDLPAAKWDWFKQRLDEGWMYAFDPRFGAPGRWSLLPEATAGMIFWTRDATNLVRDAKLVEPFKKVIHFTLTGWHEVERKAPGIERGLDILEATVETFGAENVTWRFSPIPVLSEGEVLGRFSQIAERVHALGVKEAYLSFLQNNDLMTEPRAAKERTSLLNHMMRIAGGTDLKLMLCNEDNTLREEPGFMPYGICEDGKRFSQKPTSEGCGCALSVDPFTINESCTFGCQYCYAADKSLSPRKSNTTKGSLPMVR